MPAARNGLNVRLAAHLAAPKPSLHDALYTRCKQEYRYIITIMLRRWEPS
jgi:hypothetical protein